MARTWPKIHRLFPILAVGILAGCATVPPPTGLMDRAQSEIRAARNAGAAMAAPNSLAEAERRLAAAQQFSANGDNQKATWSAEEAGAAAETARARAEAAALNARIREQTAQNQTLQADLEQRQAAAAAAQQSVVEPASGSTGAGNVTLPSIQLGQPVSGSSAAPAPASSGSVPAPASTASGTDEDSGGLQ